MRRSKDQPTFLVLFEDSAALIGLAIALLGTFAAQYFGDPLYDGLASIAIGLLLAGVGAVIASVKAQTAGTYGRIAQERYGIGG